MKVEMLNHVALHVADVAASHAFYGGVLGLLPLPRPAFDFPGAWYALGQKQELHLIGNRTAPVHSHSRGTHFALQVADIQEAVALLHEKGTPFTGPKQRPDGAWQVFVQDPDGHYIELCQPIRGPVSPPLGTATVP